MAIYPHSEAAIRGSLQTSRSAFWTILNRWPGFHGVVQISNFFLQSGIEPEPTCQGPLRPGLPLELLLVGGLLNNPDGCVLFFDEQGRSAAPQLQRSWLKPVAMDGRFKACF
jgi:hypothetical protein